MILFLSSTIFVNAQVCSLDTFTIPGIYPDTLVNLPNGYVSAAYGTVIQVRVFTDTMSIAGNVHVTDIEINSVAGMPAGFSYACFPSNCKFPGGGNGCIYLSGTTALAGTYNLVVNVTLHGKIANIIPVSQASQILGYKIHILPAPVTDFSASVNSVCKGETVTYTDLSTNQPVSWLWTFPGGTPASSTLQNPVITYNTPGTYAVTLVSTSPAGSNSKTKSAHVVVNATPTASILVAGSLAICQGSSVLLTANSGTGFTYQWIRNGLDIGNATAISYQAATAGTYKVKVTKTNGCSKISSAKTVTVSNVAATATAAGPLVFCTGGSVLLSANAGVGLTYQWIKNGVNIGGATGLQYTASVTGTFKVIVTNANGCTKVSAGIVVTANSVPSASFTAGGPLTFCAGGSVLFTANAGTNYAYQWKRNGNNINGALAMTYTATTAGTYKVIVTKTNGCSKSSATKSVVVNCKEEAGIIGTDQDNMDVSLFPNPSKDQATLRFYLPGNDLVSLQLMDMQGKVILKTESVMLGEGYHEKIFHTSALPAGLYIVQLSSARVSKHIRMMVE